MKKPKYLLGTDEVAFLEQAVKEHRVTEPFPAECSCREVVLAGMRDLHEHLRVVAFTAGMRMQGTPSAPGNRIIWMCPEPSCRERAQVTEQVLGAQTGEVIATLQRLQEHHYANEHNVNTQEIWVPNGIVKP